MTTSRSSVDPLGQAVRLGAWATLGLAAAGAGLGALLRGGPGAVGGLAGALVAAAFLGVTAASGSWARRLDASALGAVILGGWLGKMVLLIAFLAWFADQPWYDKGVFFGSLLVGTAGLLVLEARVVLAGRQPYVEPRP